MAIPIRITLAASLISAAVLVATGLELWRDLLLFSSGATCALVLQYIVTSER